MSVCEAKLIKTETDFALQIATGLAILGLVVDGEETVGVRRVLRGVHRLIQFRQLAQRYLQNTFSSKLHGPLLHHFNKAISRI